ncbi:MAG: glycerophosphodiester phosphodiesterase [Candidatus Nanopelagicales bacterium]
MSPPRHPFVLAPHPVALAHRGGGREAPENSLTAFRNATALGLRYLETDVRATSDGRVMVFHDATLNRVTDRVGRIRALPYSEVRRAKIGGADNVMLLEELLEEFPEARINIDVKDDHTLTPFVEAIRRTNTGDRICIASFSGSRLRAARVALGPTVATSLAPPEVAGLVAASRLGPLARLASFALPSNAACVQVPVRQGRVPIVTHSFISEAHRRGLAVHVWTINDEPTMNRLLDMGVDGLVTDRPTLLRSVLQLRGQWGSLAIS